jgi:hypothetical protein
MSQLDDLLRLERPYRGDLVFAIHNISKRMALKDIGDRSTVAVNRALVKITDSPKDLSPKNFTMLMQAIKGFLSDDPDIENKLCSMFMRVGPTMLARGFSSCFLALVQVRVNDALVELGVRILGKSLPSFMGWDSPDVARMHMAFTLIGGHSTLLKFIEDKRRDAFCRDYLPGKCKKVDCMRIHKVLRLQPTTTSQSSPLSPLPPPSPISSEVGQGRRGWEAKGVGGDEIDGQANSEVLEQRSLQDEALQELSAQLSTLRSDMFDMQVEASKELAAVRCQMLEEAATGLAAAMKAVGEQQQETLPMHEGKGKDERRQQDERVKEERVRAKEERQQWTREREHLKSEIKRLESRLDTIILLIPPPNQNQVQFHHSLVCL